LALIFLRSEPSCVGGPGLRREPPSGPVTYTGSAWIAIPKEVKYARSAIPRRTKAAVKRCSGNLAAPARQAAATAYARTPPSDRKTEEIADYSPGMMIFHACSRPGCGGLMSPAPFDPWRVSCASG
jgi:hypothetical protein